MWIRKSLIEPHDRAGSKRPQHQCTKLTKLNDNHLVLEIHSTMGVSVNLGTTILKLHLYTKLNEQIW